MTHSRCETCGLLVPEWPRSWRFLDDGRAFCPDHSGNVWVVKVTDPTEEFYEVRCPRCSQSATAAWMQPRPGQEP